METSPADMVSKNANHKVRKLLGRAYLRENRISEALQVYLGILKDFPEEADVLIILGNLYQLAGSPRTAERLYQSALNVNPENSLARQQIASINKINSQGWDVKDAFCTEAIDRLVQHLQHRDDGAQADEVRFSADLPEHNVEENQPGPNDQPSENSQQLMPALIELNIRQARAAGYLDLAEALQSLQISLSRQTDDQGADDLLKDDLFSGG